MSTPAHKIRNGCLQVTIWRNTGDKGSYYSAALTRSYKQGDDIWKQTESLNLDDLLPAAKLLDMAHTWIMHQLEADRKGRKEAVA